MLIATSTERRGPGANSEAGEGPLGEPWPFSRWGMGNRKVERASQVGLRGGVLPIAGQAGWQGRCLRTWGPSFQTDAARV